MIPFRWQPASSEGGAGGQDDGLSGDLLRPHGFFTGGGGTTAPFCLLIIDLFCLRVTLFCHQLVLTSSCKTCLACLQREKKKNSGQDSSAMWTPRLRTKNWRSPQLVDRAIYRSYLRLNPSPTVLPEPWLSGLRLTRIPFAAHFRVFFAVSRKTGKTKKMRFLFYSDLRSRIL